jgi:hypothetical protein
MKNGSTLSDSTGRARLHCKSSTAPCSTMAGGIRPHGATSEIDAAGHIKAARAPTVVGFAALIAREILEPLTSVVLDAPGRIIEAFYERLMHRPDSTFGTFNDDVLAFNDPEFQRADLWSIILNSRWGIASFSQNAGLRWPCEPHNELCHPRFKRSVGRWPKRRGQLTSTPGRLIHLPACLSRSRSSALRANRSGISTQSHCDETR